MQQGRGGMGSRKHGKSGWKNGSGKSPNLRLHERMEAEKSERKARPTTCIYESVAEAVDAETGSR